MLVAQLHKDLKQLYRKEVKARRYPLQRRTKLIVFSLHFPEYLRQLRGNVSQREFANAIGVSQTYISLIEQGNYENIKEETLLDILEAYSKLEEPESAGCTGVR